MQNTIKKKQLSKNNLKKKRKLKRKFKNLIKRSIFLICILLISNKVLIKPLFEDKSIKQNKVDNTNIEKVEENNLVGGSKISDNILEDEDKIVKDNLEEKLMASCRLDVSLILQNPELYNGCEITSLTMLLNYKGISVDKLTLANEMPKDNTELERGSNGEIYRWGNPNNGFVGDVYGDEIGISIAPTPLMPLVEKYYNEGALNLTGCKIEDLKKAISNNNPVLVWVTADFTRPNEFFTWIDSSGNEVQGTFETHTVLLTGYDEDSFYYNDPLSGYKDMKISSDQFEAVWTDMGKKALTINYM